ncbi:MAG TPA: DUF1611 domain-containing protein [Gemmatimonadaceae bacterium]|jgi:uncharacterized NAD-dependent epimerase/dehydratase family protein
MNSRFLILAEGAFSPLRSKTANACIRYTPESVVAVIDSTRAGQTAQDVLGFGGAIPVVASLAEGLRRKPNALLIGIAPPGGQLPASWRSLILDAIDHRLDIWSGLHTLLGDDDEFAACARDTGVTIHDLRRPPNDIDVARGRVRELDDRATVILTVGTDCNIGKMTTQLQLRDAMRARGMRVAFAATGQTGILVEGWGISVDAVIADFIAGAAERLTLQAGKEADIVLVEGQGSIIHPSYSGVTYGLLHGSLPHAMIMCAQPSRTAINNHSWVKIPPLAEFIEMQEAAVAPLRPAPVIAVALNTYDLSENDARAAIDRAMRETELPATDPVRFDPTPIIDAIDEFHRGRFGAVHHRNRLSASQSQR